jgi:hypothetical protein
MTQDVLQKTRKSLEKDGSVPTVAYIGNSQKNNTIALVIDTSSEAAKDAGAAHMEQVVSITDADFVFFVTEAWMLPRDKIKDHKKLMAIYGSIGNSPYRVDGVAFTLETRTGFWLAQAQQKKFGASQKKKTFGPVEWRQMDGATGRFAGLLQPNRA